MTERMSELVARWDAAVVADAEEQFPDHVPESGTSLRAAAAPEQVDALEQRLGVALPPSYREFLLTSNGSSAQPFFGFTPWQDPSGLLDVDHVAWLRESEPELVESWIGADDYDEPLPEVEQLPHTLKISSSVDGYVLLLNPLVECDGECDGEWEAWDFGTKNPGAERHASFRALLEAAIDALVAQAPLTPGTTPPAAAVQQAIDTLASGYFEFGRHHDLLATIRALPDPAPWTEQLVRLTQPTLHLWVRQAALDALARVSGPAPLPAILAAVAGDSDTTLRAVTIARLADETDPAIRAEAIRLVASGNAANHVRHDQKDFLWEAWQATGSLDCVRELAQRLDRRALEPMRTALMDPATDPEHRAQLVHKAGFVRDPSLVEAVVAAVAYGGVMTAHAMRTLMALEAWEEALALATPEVLADPDQLPHLVEEAILEIARRVPESSAGDLLLERFVTAPTASGAKALGWVESESAVAALESAAATKRLAKACARALERSPAPGALAALERLAASDGPARDAAVASLERRRKAPGTR